MTNNINTNDNAEVKVVSPLSSADLRKIAAEVREVGKAREQEKLMKCAKYIMGMTALVQLRDKVRSL
jgi:hypothetical protein